MKKLRHLLFAGILVSVALAQQTQAQLVIRTSFNSGIGPVGAGYDRLTDRIWLYGDFNTTLRSYQNGVFFSDLTRPGESANDADIFFSPVAFNLGSSLVSAGSLFFINGESGKAEIYAFDKVSGAQRTLATDFGNNHIVGGDYHPGRNTIFLLADKLDSTPSTIAEISPTTGAVLRTFGTGADFSVNYGDLEISRASGNLYVVSSDESSIREFTAAGVFVQDLPLPAGVSSLSGIALNEDRDEAILSGTGGTVWTVSGLTGRPVLTINQTNPTQVEVCWNSRADRRYHLQRKSSLAVTEAWTSVESNIAGTTTTICRTQIISLSPESYYYRVEVILP